MLEALQELVAEGGSFVEVETRIWFGSICASLGTKSLKQPICHAQVEMERRIEGKAEAVRGAVGR